MTKYKYDGDEVLIFPSLGLTVKKGDTFDGPDGIAVAGVTIDGKGKIAPAAPVADETDSGE